MCDEETGVRFDRKLADFIEALYKLQVELGKNNIDFCFAKLDWKWTGSIRNLDRQWQRILGAAEVIGISEVGLRARRVEIERDLGKRLDSEYDIRFNCSYGHHT